jgi:hypothetical protein
VLVVRGFPTVEDATAMNASLTRHCPDPAPFTILQMSAVVDVADPDRRPKGLIDGACAVLAGALPASWEFNSTEDLRRAGEEWLADLPRLLRTDVIDWAADAGARREYRVRVLFTRLKPAVRAILVQRGLDPFEGWTANWATLPRLVSDIDAELGSRIAALVERLPPRPDTVLEIGRDALTLLDEIASSTQ